MPEFVNYKGRTILASWPERIVAAQRVTHVRLPDATLMPRVRFGDEPSLMFSRLWFPNEAGHVLCHDCAAERGEYHVPGCDMERHPGNKEVQLEGHDVKFVEGTGGV